MKGLSGKRVEIPSMEEIMQERKRLSYRRRYKRVLKSTAYALVVVAAIAVLLATNLLPVLQVSGDSMNPTLQDQDILVLLKTDALEKGRSVRLLLAEQAAAQANHRYSRGCDFD